MENHLDVLFDLENLIKAQEFIWAYREYQAWLIAQQTLPRLIIKPLPDPEFEALLIPVLQKMDRPAYPFWPHKDPPRPEYMTRREMIAAVREVCQKNLDELDKIEKELEPTIKQVG